MSPRLEWQEISKEVASDRRDCRRVAMAIKITLTGVTLSGEAFSYRTRTTNISEHGCRFDSDHSLEPGEIVGITIDNLRGNGAHRFQVVWTEKTEDGWSVGATLISSRNIWGMVFPPRHRLRKSTHHVELPQNVESS